MRHLYISLVILILLPVLLLIGIYAATPYIVQWGGARWLAEQGFQNVVLEMERPTWNRLTVTQFAAQFETNNTLASVSAGPLTIEYSPLMLWTSQRVKRVELPQSDLRLAFVNTALPESDVSEDAFLDLTDFLPAVWFALLPSDEVQIGELNLSLDYPADQPDWNLNGALLIDDKQLYGRVRFKRDEQNLGWSDLELTSDNHFNLRLLQKNIPFVVIDGNLAADDKVALHARQVIDVEGLVAWLGRVAPTLTLPTVSGSISTRGTFELPLKTALSPEGMLQQLNARHHFTTQSSVKGMSQEVPKLALNIAGQLDMAEGALELKVAPQSLIKASPVVLPNIRIATADIVLDRAVSTTIDLKGITQTNAAPKLMLRNLPVQGKLNLSVIKTGNIRTSIRPIQFSVDSADLVQHVYQGSLEIPEIEVAIPDQKVPKLSLNTRFNIRPGAATTQFKLITKELPISLRGSTKTNFDKGQTDVTWKLATLNLAGLDDRVRPYVKQLPAELSLIDGQFDHNGKALVRSGKANLTFWNAVSNATATWNKTSVRDLQWQSKSRYSATGSFSDRGSLSIGSILSGVEATEVSTRYRFLQAPDGTQTIVIEPITADLLGGDIQIDGFETALQSPDISTSVSVVAMDVAQILELEQQQGLSGEGQLNGKFPLRYSTEGVKVKDGQLSTPKGGVIRFQPDAAVAAYAASNPGLEMALGALENFQYDTLDIKLNYQPDGTALLNTRLKGRNPDWNNGHPVDFTINVEENIPDLMKTLQFADQLTEKLEKRYGE